MAIITIITMITIRQNGSHTTPSDIMATGCICSALTTPIIVTMNDKQHLYLVLKQYSLHTWIGKQELFLNNQEMGLGSAQSRLVLERTNTNTLPNLSNTIQTHTNKPILSHHINTTTTSITNPIAYANII